ncbi:hypothetical protein GCM10010495_63490 [Kitasatospora herbaricolor]|uniref:hypothetical protein n=1 Tax=Kitasatospora herbaricolor TaxID=68217 RepID=UPI00174A3AB8|nr:hypothetical protein [Kitasatospora herbaricolor]MDQ0308384.1 hypothetical protein [Kitasatospora herbaricolor]GGV37595.1 hypothetical protein GCM10010495_63490 [Kitasatospora herbaricolor]
MSTDEKFEDDLIFAISRTGDAFQAEGTALLSGGLRRGRRRWRRGSAAAIAGSVTTLALVATGGVYLAGADGPRGDGGRAVTVAAADASGAASSGSGSPDPAASAPVSAAAAGAAAVTGEQMVGLLKALLPPGTVTVAGSRGSAGTGNQPPGAPYASLVLDDGHGAAAVEIGIQRQAPGDESLLEQVKCPDLKFQPPGVVCTSAPLADGSTLMVLQGYEYPDRRVDTLAWSATLAGKDGRLIQLQEWNAAKEKDAPVTRPTPPLTPAQLGVLVTDKSWDTVVEALPTPAPQQRSTGKEYSAEEILAITAKLLPAGLTESETGGQPGYADFVLNDGKGKSMVELNVQDWSRELKDHQQGSAKSGDVIEQLFAKARTLPDGTKVVFEKGGDKAAVWTVDSLRPDGMRVVVGAYTSGGPHQPSVRSAPVLTEAQLEAIATSPLWVLKK